MKHIEGNFKGVRDINHYYQAWLPDGEVKAVLLVVHGLGEHSGRYLNVVEYFTPRGYAVYALDHLGHGKSEGGREVVQRFEDYTDTLSIYYRMVKGWQPDRPIFLLGHSLGGLIATFYLLDHPTDFRGAIISAPLIMVGSSVSPLTILLGKVLSKLAPGMGLVGLDTSAISRDPEVVSAYVNDPLVFHGKTPARLAAEMLEAMRRVNAEMAQIRLPFITVQGADDRLVDPRGAQLLYDQAGSQDKTIHIYPGLYHEVFNEPQRDQALADVETWLAAHI
jgi:acylglycerol lipase